MRTIINCTNEAEYKELCRYFDTQPKYMWAGGVHKFSQFKPTRGDIDSSDPISFHIENSTSRIMYGRIHNGKGMSVSEFLTLSGFSAYILPEHTRDFKKMFRLNSIPLELSEEHMAMMKEKNVYNEWVNDPQST